MAKKDGRMKIKCQAYKNAGRRQINKDLKAKKHLARLEHFAKRREEGKAYKYEPPKSRKEREKRANKNVSHKLPIQKWESCFAKLDYEMQKEQIREKEKKMAKRKKTA